MHLFQQDMKIKMHGTISILGSKVACKHSIEAYPIVQVLLITVPCHSLEDSFWPPFRDVILHRHLCSRYVDTQVSRQFNISKG